MRLKKAPLNREGAMDAEKRVRELVKIHAHAGVAGPASPLTPFHRRPTLFFGDGNGAYRQIGNGFYRD